MRLRISQNSVVRLGILSRVLCLLGLIGTVAAGQLHAQAINIDTGPQSRERQFEAWGTSLAWWANSVGGWINQDARDELVELLFDQDNGLGLNYARYNIGGG
ncbi:MAG: hypothetical protein AAF790_08665, partial [Planctomycetota bacterium]